MAKAVKKSRARALSSEQRASAQRLFFIFATFNVVSFQFLSGNIITLYALRLQASAALVGLLFSFIPLAQLLPLLGRILVGRFGTVRTMGAAWILRYAAMVPVLFAPLFATDESTGSAITLITIGVLGFNLFRGIGMTGHNSVIGAITSDAERGSFLSRFQLVVHVASIVTGLAIAFLLRGDPPLLIYTFILGAGLVSGFLASIYLLRLPEPPATAGPKAPGGQATGTFLINLRGALKRSGFRNFIIVLAVAFGATAAAQPFLVVLFKQLYGQADRMVALLLVVGSLGAIIMALLSGLAVDKLGAKPLIGIFAGVITITLIPVAIAPGMAGETAVLVFGSIIFLLFTLGISGIGSSTNIYFFSIIRDSERLDMSVVFFLVTGAAASLGSLAGGALLQWLQDAFGSAAAFRIYFGVMTLASAAIVPLARRLETLGSYGVRDSLSVFFSLRDLRTLGLLNRLSRLKDASAEQSVIAQIGATKSGVSRRDLLKKLHSPRFAVRFEALTALRHTRPHAEVDEALLSELRGHTYTTAYLAADIAGSRGVKAAIPLLRESLESREHFLVAKSMVALAKLGDSDSTKTIERIVADTRNPLVIIHGATALEVLGEVSSVPILISRLERRIAPYVRDELILAVAGIVGISEYFYRVYTVFLAKGSDGIAELAGLAASRKDVDQIEEMLDHFSSDRPRFVELALQLLGGLKVKKGRHDLTTDFVAALEDERLIPLDRLRFLVAAVIVWFSPHATPRRSR